MILKEFLFFVTGHNERTLLLIMVNLGISYQVLTFLQNYRKHFVGKVFLTNVITTLRGLFLYKDEIFILHVTQGGLDKYPIPLSV